jgi:hypothetical protein
MKPLRCWVGRHSWVKEATADGCAYKTCPSPTRISHTHRASSLIAPRSPHPAVLTGLDAYPSKALLAREGRSYCDHFLAHRPDGDELSAAPVWASNDQWDGQRCTADAGSGEKTAQACHRWAELPWGV